MTMEPRGMTTSPTRSSSIASRSTHPERRVETKRLLNDLGRECQFRNVAVAQRPVAEHFVKFLTHSFQAIRPRAQMLQEPRERIGGRLVPRNEKLHALAEDEFVAHTLTVGVPRVHQRLQQVGTGRFVPPRLDVLEQNRIRARTHLLVLAEFSRNGEPGVEIGLKGLPDDEFLDGADGLTDKLDVFIPEPSAPNSDRATMANVIFIS